MAGDDAPASPSRGDIEARITALIEGTATPEAVAEWAMRWDDARDPGVDDPVAWELLNNLAGAESPTIDREYLYDQVFEAWREARRAARHRDLRLRRRHLAYSNARAT